MKHPIRVLIVEDSRFMQKALTTMLAGDAQIEVVGTASDPFQARDMVRQLSPDVLTLDIEMPRMDGLTFLEKLMALRPLPVVVVSSFSTQNAPLAIRALELGAFDVVAKPDGADMPALLQLRSEIGLKVKAAAKAHFRPAREAYSDFPYAMGEARAECVIGIGASTGGVEALRILLSQLPATCPPIMVTQHLPLIFTSSFARRLDQLSSLHVMEASHDQPLKKGEVYIAPGDRHLRIAAHKNGWKIMLELGEKLNGHCPSVDAMFTSLAQQAGAKAVGVLLTGMGSDGANGLLEMRRAQSVTLAQDEESCVVFGMPGAAGKLGAVQRFVPLSQMAEAILYSCHRPLRKRGADFAHSPIGHNPATA